MQNNLRRLVQGGAIAALYAGLTLAFAPIGFGPLQLRVAEALTVLPFFTPAAIPGLFVGCAVANLFSPFGIVDVIAGSVATLLAALVTWKIKNRWLAPLPSVVFNSIIVGTVVGTMEGLPLWMTMLQVAGGQALACYALGLPLLLGLQRLHIKFD